MPSEFWSVPREWAGETAFIIGGGPSVTQAQVDILRGRHVIVINSSYSIAPWADYLIFSDDRWLEPPLGHWQKVKAFQRRIVSASPKPFTRDLLRLRRCRPPEFGFSPDTVCVNWTTYTAAINLACHLVGEGGSIVCLGLDAKTAQDGRRHHHAPHPIEWGRSGDTFAEQDGDLQTLLAPLKALRIACVNASPDTALDVFSKVILENVLASLS